MDHYRNNNPRGVGRGGNGGGGQQQRMAAVGSRREPPRLQPQPVSSLLGMVPGLDNIGSGRGHAGGGGNGNSLRPMRNQFSGGMDQRSRNDFMDSSPGPGMSNPGRSSYDGMGGGGRPRPSQQQDRYWSSDYGHEDDRPSTRNDFSSVMDTYGLSRDDLQELLQLPDHELSAGNLAKVIEALSRNKGNNYNNSMSDFGGNNRTPTRGNGGSAGYRGGPGSGGGDRFDSGGNAQRGILGPAPMPDMSNSSRGNYRDDHYKSDRDFDMAPPPRNLDSWNDRPLSPPIGRPRNSAPNFRSRNDDSFDGDDGVGGGYHRSSGRRANLERDLIDEDFSPSGSRYNDEEDDYLRASQKRSSRTAALRHEPRNARPRNLDESHRNDGGRKPPPLMGRKVPPSNSLLGDPPRKVSSRSMDHIRPAGRPEHALLNSASSSAAALINSIPADPALIGAQIRAMRVLQMEALKLNDLTMKRERMERMRRMDRMDSSYEQERIDRMPRGGPLGGPSKNMGGDYGDREEGGGVMSRKEKAEVMKMRQQKGRVLYMRFKSYRVTDDDLKNLAKPFGRVTRVFIIKAKGPSIMNQAFMELERYDCASAMLEHYFINPPRVKGCKILIDRSNYREWSRKDTVKRATSPSTGAKGGKRARMSPGKKQTGDGKSRNVGDLNVQISSNERRVVTRDDRKTDGKGSTTGDIKDRLGARRASEDGKSATTAGNGAGSNAPKNQKKNTNANRRRKAAMAKRAAASDTPADLRDLIGNDSTKNADDQQQEKKEEKAAGEDKNAAELPISDDPLDAIADELAMDDDFVLMDSVGGDEKDDDDDDDEEAEKVDDDDDDDDQAGGDLDCQSTDLSANIEVPDIDIENLGTDEKTTKQEMDAEETTTTVEEIKQEKNDESSNVDTEKKEEAVVASIKQEYVESNTAAAEDETTSKTEAATDAHQEVKVEANKDSTIAERRVKEEKTDSNE